MAMDTITQWVGHVAQMFAAGGAAQLVASFPLEPAHPFWNPLKQATEEAPSNAITTTSILPKVGAGIAADVRETFASFLAAELAYVKGQAAGTDEDRAVGDFQRLASVQIEANRLYDTQGTDGNHSYPFLNDLIVMLSRQLMIISGKAADLSTQPVRSPTSSRSIRDTTRQIIEKSYQVSASKFREEWVILSQKQHVVGDIIWTLANILWRTYAERKLHTQAMEIRRSILSLTPDEDTRLQSRGHLIRQADVCQSYYWRGRIHVVLLQMREAKRWLDQAWSICPESAWQQRRSILIKLVPVNLLLGLLPTPAVIQQYKLEPFLPLIHAFRTGNIPAWRRELDQNREWYRSRSIWLLLYERGEILVWRNLFRRALKEYLKIGLQAGIAPRNRCDTWIFVSATRACFAGSGELEEGTIILDDIISVLSSLIDQGFVKAILAYSSNSMSLKPSADGLGAFVPIHQVVPRQV